MKSSFTLNRREEPRKIAERFVQAGGTTFRFLEAGVEHLGSPLVMLHGYRAGADYWFPYPIPELARHHHIIAPDLPGFGYSGRLPDYSLPAYASALAAFFDALGLEKVDLMGHSFGSQVAIATAATYPSRVDRLVLVDSAGLPRLEPQWQVPVRMLADASMRHFRIYPTILRLGARATAGKEALKILQGEHVGHYLKSLTMPTLIVWGSRDRVVPLEHGGLLAKFIPNARLAVIRGAGHMPFYQKPEEFNRLVLAFLRRGQQAGIRSDESTNTEAEVATAR